MTQGLRELQPLFGNFHLISVDDFLIENTEIVPDAITDGGQFERCHGIEKACRQTAETAVAQSRIAFLVDDVFHVQAQFTHCIFAGIVIMPRFMILLDKKPSHEEFH